MGCYQSIVQVHQTHYAVLLAPFFQELPCDRFMTLLTLLFKMEGQKCRKAPSVPSVLTPRAALLGRFPAVWSQVLRAKSGQFEEAAVVPQDFGD